MLGSWIIPALIAPLSLGAANIIDNALVKRQKHGYWPLIFVTVLISVFFLPLLYLIESPGVLTVQDAPGYLLVAVVGVLAYLPYFYSLKIEDTSTVISLFSMGRIFLAILAYLLIGEILSIWQYLGLGLIVISSFFLTFEKKKKMNLHLSFWYMLVCSLLWAFQLVLFKSMLNTISWATGLFWTTLFSLFLTSGMLVFSGPRNSLLHYLRHMKSDIVYLIVEGAFIFVGTAASMAAISMAPVTVVKSIGALQPLIILLYALILRPIFPRIFHENRSKKRTVFKVLLFVLTIIGTYFVAA